MIRYITGILIILIFSHTGVRGQDNTFYADANPRSLNVQSGVPFSVEYSLKYRGQSLTLQHSGIKVIKPKLSDLEIVDEYQGGGMQFDFGGGDITVHKYTLVLKAKTTGNKSIGPLKFVMNNKTYVSPDVKVDVSKGQDVTSSPAKPKGPDPDDLFARMSVSGQSVTQGSAIIVTHKVYSKVNLVSLGDVSFPGFEGFWSEEVPSKDVKLSNETINGTTYRVVELKKHVIFPRNSGKVTISPLSVECIVQEIRERPSRNANERFFYGPTVRFRDNIKYQVKSPSVSIDVSAFPASGKPASFDGIVGNYSIDAVMDASQARTNEAMTLTFKVGGKGNLSKFPIPKFIFPPDFEVYEPELTSNFKASASGVSGSKTWSWLLIPRREGDYSIPSLALSFFDPATGRYVEELVPEFAITVEKGDGTESMVSVSGTTQEDVQFIGKDIRFIHTGMQLADSKKGSFVGSLLFYLLWLLPPALLALYFIIDNKRKSTESLISRTQRKAAAKAGKKLKHSARTKQKDEAKYLEELNQALLTYAMDRFGIERAGFTADSACAAIETSASTEFGDKFRVILEECEYNRFAPPSGEGMDEPLHIRALQLIGELEKALK